MKSPSCRGRAGTPELQIKISNSAAEQTGRRDYMASKVDWQLSGCDCIVVVEFVHTTSVLCTVNYEPCTIRHKFKSMGNKVDVM